MSSQKLFVNKTGFEMFDCFRAYGLALLINGLGSDVETRIHDFGPTYVIDVKGDLPRNTDPKIFEKTESNSWLLVFRTFKERKDLKRKLPLEDVRDIAIQNYSKILDLYKRRDFVPEISTKVKDGKTLYQTIDVSAAKGYREEKRLTYHEGSQLQVDKFSWCIAAIGAAWFGVWPRNLMRRDVGFSVCIVPNPERVLLITHREVHENVEKQLCPISANTAIVHYSIKLVNKALRKSDEVNYDEVIFNVMQKTGQQPKPGGGGKYSLTFLNELVQTNMGPQVLDYIDKYLLPINPNVKGIRQDIALALSDFLLRPTLDNFRRFESLYIRGEINRELFPWEKSQLEELLKYVEFA
ncbi:MAG: hypothetical protein N3F10_02175 [Candidatus Bathyarchaeota archaeon]|nr:hypothetical protein [Candidatus Bathyarchaeota archaeon]MCX8177091.1 hypothetical protein [Candidatus Bathyarchaeota archaeon]MDW8193737.1 hypothetical protein [Nitrososphaerota archaeon]